MSKYRILEKKGETTYKVLPCSIHCFECDISYATRKPGITPTCKIIEHSKKEVYTPRYIVQEQTISFDEDRNCSLDWSDLKEFNDLDKARAYKNDLELIEGRVIE